MSALPELRVDTLGDGKVKIIGLTPEPIECSGERFVTLLNLCTTDAWKKVEDQEDDELRQSGELSGW